MKVGFISEIIVIKAAILTVERLWERSLLKMVLCKLFVVHKLWPQAKVTSKLRKKQVSITQVKVEMGKVQREKTECPILCYFFFLLYFIRAWNHFYKRFIICLTWPIARHLRPLVVCAWFQLWDTEQCFPLDYYRNNWKTCDLFSVIWYLIFLLK